jgi:hypothetical protein
VEEIKKLKIYNYLAGRREFGGWFYLVNVTSNVPDGYRDCIEKFFKAISRKLTIRS